jgi:UDP-GlcNAc:undecaprenyl-phosphate GlcNAc-1-phosphate transferase
VSGAALFALAAAAGALGTLAARALARRVGLLNAPNPIVPQHVRPVAYLGGVGVAAGLAAGLAAAAAAGARWPAGLPLPGLLAGAAAFLALGTWDDARPLAWRPKLALQAAAALAAAAGGVVLPLSGWPLVDGALAVLWIVVVVNAVNLTDVCDGLVAGLLAVTCALLAATRPEVAPVALAAGAAAAGFLLFNRPPASIFLGDGGAHLLGFVLAALLLADARGAPPAQAAGRVALLAGVPLFELAFLVAMRRRKGLPWWRGSPDHFSLRLQAAGLTRWQTDAVAWSAAAALALAAALLPRLPLPGQAALAAAVAAAGAAAWRALARWEVGPRPLREGP